MQIDLFIVYLGLVLIGLCMGSFAGASVWRLRARQLAQDKLNGEEVDEKEYSALKKLTKRSIIKDHSECLHCSYKLKWYDLIPLISWLFLRGKCRKCHKRIGYLEPLVELSVAVLFVVSYIFWPYTLNNSLEVIRLIIWLVSGVGLAILFIYDKKWFILPNIITYTIILLGAINSILVILASQDKVGSLFSILGSILILSGIYFILYVVSRGKWIGFGDIKLGLGLALLLADWRLAFIALFAANLIGCIIVLPAMIVGKLKRDSHVPFGPLLIAGTIVAILAGNYLINLYFLCIV
jgi:prepilin signal peptidase PulO-like enzyme (type II secretory pathway)